MFLSYARTAPEPLRSPPTILPVPELPEVERIRLTLEPLLVGARITKATLARRRRDIVTGRAQPTDLLEGHTITELRRKGKQLAILAHARVQPSPRILLVHLGMSGQLFHLASGASPADPTHIHATWHLTRRDDRATDSARGIGAAPPRLIFRDPRRFGGLWTIPSLTALTEHWQSLGPDALIQDIAPAITALASTTRAIKAALLDQAILAGVGNIYADEALHRAGIAPARPCRSLTTAERARLTRAIPAILRQALDAGGSTLRDYRDGAGASGSAQKLHAVYGRAGLACLTCSAILATSQLAQRTTVWCPRCQP